MQHQRNTMAIAQLKNYYELLWIKQILRPLPLRQQNHWRHLRWRRPCFRAVCLARFPNVYRCGGSHRNLGRGGIHGNERCGACQSRCSFSQVCIYQPQDHQSHHSRSSRIKCFFPVVNKFVWWCSVGGVQGRWFQQFNHVCQYWDHQTN